MEKRPFAMGKKKNTYSYYLFKFLFCSLLLQEDEWIDEVMMSCDNISPLLDRESNSIDDR